MIDVAVFTLPNLVASIVSGVVAGTYLVAIHPPIDRGFARRRSVLFGWFLGFPMSILYFARAAIAIYRQQTEAGFVTDLPRVLGGWLLALVFAAFVVIGAQIGIRIRERWRRRRVARERRDDLTV